MDRFSPDKRHEVMSRIRGKDTKPEMIVRRFLFSQGFRFRLHYRKLPGHPDIVLPKYRAVVFVHGCFWHRHENCRHFRLPQSNVEYWENKIAGNVERDLRDANRIADMGWKVIVIWECELERKTRDEVLNRVATLIKGSCEGIGAESCPG